MQKIAFVLKAFLFEKLKCVKYFLIFGCTIMLITQKSIFLKKGIDFANGVWYNNYRDLKMCL